MRRGAALTVAMLVLAGCRARPTPPPPTRSAEPRSVAVSVDDKAGLPAVEGPGRWSGAGMRVPVPEGWSAWTNRPAALVTLTHDGGSTLQIMEGGAPASRPGCRWAFRDDVGRHRTAGALAPARIAHCQPADPSQETVLAWWGALSGRPLRIELQLPPGELVRGADAAQPVLDGLGALREPLSGGGAGGR